jgi:hypothetical protein
MDDSTADLILRQALNEPLDEADLADLDAALARSPELQTELAQFQAAAQSLAYAAPLQPMADLKQRLFSRVGSTQLIESLAEPLADRPEVCSPDLTPLLDWSLADLAAPAWRPARPQSGASIGRPIKWHLLSGQGGAIGSRPIAMRRGSCCWSFKVIFATAIGPIPRAIGSIQRPKVCINRQRNPAA